MSRIAYFCALKIMIYAKNIHKYYNNLHVLDGVDLHIKEKEVVSVVGASGAGKTTLLQILGTLETPTSGELILKGKEVYKLPKSNLTKFRNNHIGFVFQFHQLLPEFTALENVCLPAFIKKTPKKTAIAKAAELLEFLGLSERIDHKPSELSGGEQQRVAVARALVNNPEIILADEPSGNLDSESAENLHQLFFKLREEFDHTFVIVTHNEELADMADRKLTIVDGKIKNNEK